MNMLSWNALKWNPEVGIWCQRNGRRRIVLRLQLRKLILRQSVSSFKVARSTDPRKARMLEHEIGSLIQSGLPRRGILAVGRGHGGSLNTVGSNAYLSGRLCLDSDVVPLNIGSRAHCCLYRRSDLPSIPSDLR